MTQYYRFCVSCELPIAADEIFCEQCIAVGNATKNDTATIGQGTNSGQKWISNDDRDLVNLYKQGALNVSNLSVHFGRSRSAIQLRLAYNLGLEFIHVKEYFDGTASEKAIEANLAATSGIRQVSHNETDLIKLHQEENRQLDIIPKQVPAQKNRVQDSHHSSIDGILVSKTAKYRLINTPQEGHEWHRWRHAGIGASDAPIVMRRGRGISVAKFINQRANKLQVDSFQNGYMAEGKALEPHARALYNQTMKTDVAPVCVESIEAPWLRASLDGLSITQDKVIEIKCGPSTFKEVHASRRIPTRYYAQVQHILAIVGLGSIDFWCYRPEIPAVLVVVERDDRYINELLQREAVVWASIESRRVGL